MSLFSRKVPSNGNRGCIGVGSRNFWNGWITHDSCFCVDTGTVKANVPNCYLLG